MLLVQKIEKTYGTQLEIVIKYYALLNVLNSLSLSQQDLLILAYTNSRGSLSQRGVKEEFCETFDVPLSSFYNYMRKLIKRGFLYKKGKQITIAPQLHIDASSLLLNIHIKQEHEE